MVLLNKETISIGTTEMERPEVDAQLPGTRTTSSCPQTWQWLMVLGVVLGAIFLRWHLLDVPLERDEGEYAYGGQLLLQGVPPYQMLFNMKLPGIYAVYSLILLVFGQNSAGIHLGLLCANVASITALFLVGSRIAGPLAGISSAAVFTVLSVGQTVQGVFANAEHFVLVPVLFGALAVVVGLDSKRPWLFFLSGILFGFGFVIKQHGALFALWAGGATAAAGIFGYIRQRDSVRYLIFFLLGVVLPYGLTCLLLWKAGVFSQFWFWTIDYAKAYATQIPWFAAWANLTDRGFVIWSASPLLWTAAAIGILVCLARFRSVRHPGLVLSFAFFSFLAVCPGFFFRPHYFVLLLPAAALLAGVTISSLARFVVRDQRRQWSLLVVAITLFLLLGDTLYRQRHFLFQLTPAQASTDTYWPNPFNESVEIARFIRQNSKPSDTIAIVGSEPQICFYAARRSATGYIYMYPLMEGHEFALEMQRRLIAEVEQAKPEYLIFVRIDTSWLQRPDSHTLIYEWFTGYKEGYERVGMVEIFEKTTRYSWLKESVWPPQTPYWIEVLRKKGGKTGEGS